MRPAPWCLRARRAGGCGHSARVCRVWNKRCICSLRCPGLPLMPVPARPAPSPRSRQGNPLLAGGLEDIEVAVHLAVHGVYEAEYLKELVDVDAVVAVDVHEAQHRVRVGDGL